MVSAIRSPWNVAALVFGLLGTAIAGYLTLVHYQDRLLVCGVGDCETVQSSKYSMLGPAPVALLGLIGMAVLLALVVARVAKPELEFPLTVAIFGLVFVGTAFEAYLTYLEIWVIEAICQWCVAFAVVLTLWLAVETSRLWRAL